MKNGVVNGGKKGKSQGTGGSANANDCVDMDEPHIRFCTIGKCDLLSFFLSIQSLPVAVGSHKTSISCANNMWSKCME
jgi:hypothetical protein